MKIKNWRKYAFEFLSIFVAVISAFALNNWNDHRKARIAESKIFIEIINGLEKDKKDIQSNIGGHRQGIKSCNFWRKIIRGEKVNTDSLQFYYLLLTRDFISIQNTSGYETLKSRGFEIITNDSLRKEIISLYEFDYQNLRKLEEEYNEAQFQENYFHKINDVIAPYFKYDLKGNIVSIDLPLRLQRAKKNILLSYLWKIQVNREFVLNQYKSVENQIDNLIASLQKEIEQ